MCLCIDFFRRSIYYNLGKIRSQSQASRDPVLGQSDVREDETVGAPWTLADHYCSTTQRLLQKTGAASRL